MNQLWSHLTKNLQHISISNCRGKAARLGFGIIKNHPFIDGNKRIGAHIMLPVLCINGIDIEYTQDELIEIVISVASGEKNFDDLKD